MDSILDRNRVLAAHGNHEGLLFAFNAIDATPGYDGHYLHLSNLLTSLGDSAAASAALSKAGSLAGSAGESVHEGVLFALNAVKATPDYAGGYVRLGNLLFSLGLKADAISAFTKALQIDPAGLDAKRFLDLAEGKAAPAVKPVTPAAPVPPAAPAAAAPRPAAPQPAPRPAAPPAKPEGFFRRLIRGLFGG